MKIRPPLHVSLNGLVTELVQKGNVQGGSAFIYFSKLARTLYVALQIGLMDICYGVANREINTCFWSGLVTGVADCVI